MKTSDLMPVKSGDELYVQTGAGMFKMELKMMPKPSALAAMAKLRPSDKDHLHDSRAFIPERARK
jgi:hypothetical protein